MAKKNKSLDEALEKAVEDLLKDEKKAMKGAIKFAKDEALKDFMAKAESCLMEYYNERSPESYDRTNSLKQSFLPYEKVVTKGDVVEGSVGVQYSARKLQEYIEANQPKSWEREDGSLHGGYYGSRKDFFQPVDAAWVINNYLEGIHPTTVNVYAEDNFITYQVNGKERKQKMLIGSTYVPVKVGPSANEKMEKFKNEYKKTFDDNLLLGLMAQLATKIK